MGGPKKSKSTKKVRVNGGKTIKRTTMTQKARLTLPVSKFLRLLREGGYTRRVSPSAGVYLAALMESIVVDIFRLCVEEAEAANKTRITNRIFNLAMRKDEYMAQLMKGVVIVQGGVVPHVEPEILRRALKTGDEEAAKEKKQKKTKASGGNKGKEANDDED